MVIFATIKTKHVSIMKTKLNLGLFAGMMALLVVTMTSCGNDRDKFLGVFNVNDACNSGNYTYQVTISESSSGGDAVLISNFGGYQPSITVSATISGDNITIPTQTVAGASISGSGSLSGNILTMVTSVSINGNTENCTATGTKQ